MRSFARILPATKVMASGSKKRLGKRRPVGGAGRQVRRRANVNLRRCDERDRRSGIPTVRGNLRRQQATEDNDYEPASPRLDRLNYSGSMAWPFAALCGRTSNLYPTPGTERMNRGAFGSGSILRRKRATSISTLRS
jgi:hypothetical protein